jgi:uncharacterized protein (DUF1778 family)
MMTNALKRMKRLTVRFRPHEWDVFVAAAAASRQPLAEFARDALNAVAQGVPGRDRAGDRTDQSP